MSFDPISETNSDCCHVDALAGPSNDGGDDGSQTISAQHEGTYGEPQVESPEARKRKAPSIGDADK